MAFILGRNRKPSEAGFTLIELLVVISILGVLAAVVVLNVTRFMTAGTSEAFELERKNVCTAAGLYIYDGHSIASPTTVGPGELGIIAPWLTGDLKYYWVINTDGSVVHLLYGSSLGSLDGFTVASGGWTAGEDGLSAGGTAGSLSVTGGSWDDFTFSTTTTFSPTDGYGMTYRGDADGNNGYVLTFDPGSDTFTVAKIVNGVISAPLASASVAAGFSGQHSISISAQGSSHSISIDGATVMTFTDGTFGSGTVGLQSASGSNVNFTSFTVSPP